MRKNIYLWEEDIPYFNKDYEQSPPSITEYFLNNGKKNPCVLVIPGGAYSFVSIQHEGEDVCKALNNRGISAAYLNYRVAPYKHPVMETDAKRAVRLLKYNSAKWNIDADKISIMGFSAGGHLACMIGLRFDDDNCTEDEIDKISAKPVTVASCYGVCSLDPSVTHMDTLHNLLGENPDEEMIKRLSSENIIRKDTPPFFIWHTEEDTGVRPENSKRLACALTRENIPCEFHLFPFGEHGLGLAENTPFAENWLNLYVNWLEKYIF